MRTAAAPDRAPAGHVCCTAAAHSCVAARLLRTVCRPGLTLPACQTEHAGVLPDRAPRPLAARRSRVAAMFGGDDEDMQEGLEQGARVRVKSAVTVYHSPKLGDLNLEGKEGIVQEARPRPAAEPAPCVLLAEAKAPSLHLSAAFAASWHSMV